MFARGCLVPVFSRHPYTRIEFIERDLNVTRLTATRYLDLLAQDGFLLKRKIGRGSYYINTALTEILMGGQAWGARANVGNRGGPRVASDVILPPMEFLASWQLIRLDDICSQLGSGATPTGGQASHLPCSERSAEDRCAGSANITGIFIHAHPRNFA